MFDVVPRDRGSAAAGRGTFMYGANRSVIGNKTSHYMNLLLFSV